MSAQIEFQRLIDIMKRLRKECPWDKKQTPQSLRQYIFEEAYEVVESIDDENWDELKRELGDLLLQIVFQAKIGEEESRFTLQEIIEHINEKLIRRHPHVFGDKVAENPEQVKENWEQIKIQQENRKSILEGVPGSLSGLLRAQRIQDKAAQVGFDWEDSKGVLEKIKEEISELEVANQQQNVEEMESELGDLLFSLVNLARFKKINAEDALRGTINKFISRFKYIEDNLSKSNKSIYESSMEEMDRLWEEAKNNQA